jgi:tetratricopeptide (TPR) repeat protein
MTPTLPEGFVGLGRVALARDDLDTAGKHFAEATALGTDNFEALLYGSIALIRLGKSAEAVPALTKAVQQRPTHAEANYYLGQALAVSDGDAALAVTYLVRARDLRKELSGSCAMLEGTAQYRANKTAEAAISFLRASNTEKDNPIVPLALAITKAAVSETEDALAVLAQAKQQGNPFADKLAEIIKSGKSLPKLGYSRRGFPIVVGLTIPAGEEAPEETKPEPAKPGKDGKGVFDVPEK